mgnify:CR=1 FL=1
MAVGLHPHAIERAAERGATPEETTATVETGETFPAKHGRTGFRRNFPGPWTWRDREFDTKQVEVYAAEQDGDWLVITVIVRFIGRRAT